MIVVSVTDCPPRLRGDLSKWLIEINTGVYVGRVSARVREELWQRVCEHLPNGRATMVFSAANEQRMSFHVHNTTWEPVDFDGLTLIRRPAPAKKAEDELPEQKSKAALYHKLQNIRTSQVKREQQAGYVVVSLKTTGPDTTNDEIVELAAMRIIAHQPAAQVSFFIMPERPLTEDCLNELGITWQKFKAEAIPKEFAMTQFCEFIDTSPIVGYNIALEREFLSRVCEKYCLAPLKNIGKDIRKLTLRLLDDVPNDLLTTLCERLNLSKPEDCRALSSCLTIFHLYEKLNEI